MNTSLLITYPCPCHVLCIEMMPAFDNYISFGSARLLTDPAYMAAIVDMVTKVLEVCILTAFC